MYYVFVQLINRLSIYFAGSGAFVLAESGTFVLAGSGAFGAWVGLLRGSGLRAVWQCGSRLPSQRRCGSGLYLWQCSSRLRGCLAVWLRAVWQCGSGLRVVWQCGSGLRGCIKAWQRHEKRQAVTDPLPHQPGSGSLLPTQQTAAMASPSRRLISRTPWVARPATRMSLTATRMVIPERVMIIRSFSSVTDLIAISFSGLIGNIQGFYAFAPAVCLPVIFNQRTFAATRVR